MKSKETILEQRILLAAPTRRDGDVSRELFTKMGLHCALCSDLPQLVTEIERGAGTILLTERVLLLPAFETVQAALQNQPSWSDLSLILLLQGTSSPQRITELLASLSNVIVLQRPAPMHNVVTAIKAALRARNRQYQFRDQLEVIRNSQIEMRTLGEQLESALNASLLGTFHCPVPLGPVEWNDRCKECFFLPNDAVVNFDVFYSRLHPDDRERTRQAIEASVSENAPYAIEYRVVSPSGEVRWIRSTGRTYFDDQGQATRFDGTVLNITEERQLLEERQHLLDSERAARRDAEHANRMKDEFLATLSHELRTPLNAILGWSQLLKLDPTDSEAVEEAVDVIDRNVRVQTQLIEDLLDMSRIISGKVRLNIQRIDLAMVIRAAIESVEPAIAAKGIHLQKVIDPLLGEVSGDSGRLQQVIWNLLTNATKFTPKDGHIRVLAERVNSHVEISVMDNGLGIDPKFLPHLFERFSQADGSTTRHHGGLGLGLSIVKQLVEMHGGSVRAESLGLEMGATFVLTLPMRVMKSTIADNGYSQMSSDNSVLDSPLQNLQGLKVLVVDDEPDARELVKRLLVGCRAIPETAASADEAQALLYSFQPAVILSDIGMPGRDGYEFMRQVRKNGFKIPAIALTAFARAEDRVRSLQAGYQSHLSKPVEPAELLALIARLSEGNNSVVNP